MRKVLEWVVIAAGFVSLCVVIAAVYQKMGWSFFLYWGVDSAVILGLYFWVVKREKRKNQEDGK
jgi:predicted RND superfamily exporter protein